MTIGNYEPQHFQYGSKGIADMSIISRYFILPMLGPGRGLGLISTQLTSYLTWQPLEGHRIQRGPLSTSMLIWRSVQNLGINPNQV